MEWGPRAGPLVDDEVSEGWSLDPRLTPASPEAQLTQPLTPKTGSCRKLWVEVLIKTRGPLCLWTRTPHRTGERSFWKPRSPGNPHFLINGPSIFFVPRCVKDPEIRTFPTSFSQHPNQRDGN